jgi:phosphatidylglycerophosphatase A
MVLSEKFIILFATGGYVGNSPIAPGTVGSLWGVPLAFALSHLPLGIATGILIVLMIGSIWVAGRSEALMGGKDPGAIVIDEVVGMAVALLGLPFAPATVIWGFILFRLLDIAKPFPIGWLDRRLNGGVGIVADDVAAGIFANLILRVLLVFMA